MQHSNINKFQTNAQLESPMPQAAQIKGKAQEEKPETDMKLVQESEN